MLLRNAYINEAYKYIKPIINKALVDFKDDIKMPLKFNYKYMTSAFGNCYPKKRKNYHLVVFVLSLSQSL
ncbi:MAG: hypothetical protein L6U99_10855 [Clostridium sp.]|nr:MAG: hypothetical protein L6U99_10855 [Clostridium sp.]